MTVCIFTSNPHHNTLKGLQMNKEIKLFKIKPKSVPLPILSFSSLSPCPLGAAEFHLDRKAGLMKTNLENIKYLSNYEVDNVKE